MVARKSFGGDRDAAVDYIGIGRRVLDQLLASMQMNGLQVLSNAITLDNGVRITVSSVFGQHDIRIDAPPAASADVQAQVDALADDTPLIPPIVGTLQDVVRVSGSIRMTLTSPDFTEGFNPDPSSGDASQTNNLISVQLRDHILVRGSITITATTATYSSYTPPAMHPQIFIGGQTSKGQDAFVWDDVNGYQPLNLGNTSQRKQGKVFGFSPDGVIIVGQVQLLQGNSFYPDAAKWSDRNAEAQVCGYGSSAGTMQTATSASSSGMVYGTGVGGSSNSFATKFQWDGQNNHSPSVYSGTVPAASLTSPNKRLVISGQKYQLDGGSWINWGPNSPTLATGVRQAPSDAVAMGVMHYPYVDPGPPPPTYTTTVLVFSA